MSRGGLSAAPEPAWEQGATENRSTPLPPLWGGAQESVHPVPGSQPLHMHVEARGAQPPHQVLCECRLLAPALEMSCGQLAMMGLAAPPAALTDSELLGGVWESAFGSWFCLNPEV